MRRRPFFRERFLHYAVMMNIGDSLQVGNAIFTNNSANLDAIEPDIRQAVYCAAMWNDNGTNFK